MFCFQKERKIGPSSNQKKMYLFKWLKWSPDLVLTKGGTRNYKQICVGIFTPLFCKSVILENCKLKSNLVITQLLMKTRIPSIIVKKEVYVCFWILFCHSLFNRFTRKNVIRSSLLNWAPYIPISTWLFPWKERSETIAV